jgi:hypothetical protein
MADPDIDITNRHIPVPEESIRSFCRKWNVTRFRLYGSILRDDFRHDSDVDVMVECDPEAKTSFSDLLSMQEELEALFSRKVDLADRRSVEQSENYIRKHGMFSGKPPVLRQMSYLLDMLICARKIQGITESRSRDNFNEDELLFHALSYYCRWLVISASRVDINTRQKYQELPWSVFPESTTEIESDPYFPGKQQVDEMTWQVTPRIIPLLVAIIPAEDEI